MLNELSISDFLARTAADKPVPGGGSVAALAAALGAALAEMVAGLTVGRKGFEPVDEEMAGIIQTAGGLRNKLSADIDRDADAYSAVIAAFRKPKADEAEAEARRKAIQDAFKRAALVPLDVANDAVEVMDLAGAVVARGNPNAVTDGAAAVLMARAAARAVLLNVRVNLGSIRDEAFVAEVSRQAEALDGEVRTREQAILAGISM